MAKPLAAAAAARPRGQQIGGSWWVAAPNRSAVIGSKSFLLFIAERNESARSSAGVVHSVSSVLFSWMVTPAALSAFCTASWIWPTLLNRTASPDLMPWAGLALTRTKPWSHAWPGLMVPSAGTRGFV